MILLKFVQRIPDRNSVIRLPKETSSQDPQNHSCHKLLSPAIFKLFVSISYLEYSDLFTLALTLSARAHPVNWFIMRGLTSSHNKFIN